MSIKDVSSELLTDAGLSEKETKIYLTILGLGNATIGQISQITGFDIFETSEILPNLESMGYVKKLPGILHRYIPMEPFIRAVVDIDKRFQIDMSQIRDAFTNDVNEFTTNIEKIYEELTRTFDLAEDRFGTSDISSTTETRLGELFTEQKSNYESVKEKGSAALKNIIADLSDKLMKGVGERQGRVGQITLRSIDAAKTSLETSRQNLASLSSELSSELQDEAETLKSELISSLDQHIDFHDDMTQKILQEVETTVEKYQEEFARSSTHLKEDFIRLVDSQDEMITKEHDALQSSLQNVFDKIAKEWDKTSSQVQPEFDNVITSLSELGKRLKALGEEISTIQVGFRKPFPQEAIAAKTESLSTELDTLVKDTTTLLTRLNSPIKSALAGSQTMTQEAEGVLSNSTAKTKEQLENQKQEAEQRIVGKIREFKADLVGENREKLDDYCSKVENLVTKTKDYIDSKLSERLKTQTEQIEQFTPKADHQHMEAANHVEIELTKARKEVDGLLDDHCKNSQALFQEKENEIAASLGEHLEVFNSKTDQLNEDIMNQLEAHFEAQVNELEKVTEEIDGAIEPIVTKLKETAREVERAVGEKIIATVMRTEATESALSKIQDASEQIMPVVTAHTWAILGKQNIQPLINDMLARTKSSITIIVPELSVNLLQRIADLPRTRKVTLVSEIDIDQYERELGSLLDQGNVQIRHYDKKDINMGIRDAEEAFMALETPEEEFVTILTENERFIQLLQKIMLSEFVSIARPVRF